MNLENYENLESYFANWTIDSRCLKTNQTTKSFYNIYYENNKILIDISGEDSGSIIRSYKDGFEVSAKHSEESIFIKGNFKDLVDSLMGVTLHFCLVIPAAFLVPKLFPLNDKIFNFVDNGGVISECNFILGEEIEVNCKSKYQRLNKQDRTSGST